jgi:hypothetical protein
MKHQFRNHTIYSDDNLIHYMRSNIDIGSSLLDLGCGPKIYSQALLNLCAKQITVDAWPDVEPDILADLETVDIKTLVDSVDYILMIDFIEHLDKEAGIRLLDDCKKIVNNKIFLLTPLPEIWTDNIHNIENERIWSHGNQFDIHKSSWTHSDFEGWTEVKLPSLEKYYVGYYEA